jgi:glycosyltransferase involved in cell wall biosynthesis
MRWLQWSTIDLQNGLGGVEVHARSLARELEKRGIEAAFSRNTEDLDDPKWDVIHTHGSAYFRKGSSTAIRVHTLHGTTLGRMAACGEWTWPGGYVAASRELRAVLNANVVLSVHPKLSLFRLAQKLDKTTAVCWNGWDPTDLPGVESALSMNLSTSLQELQSFWLFVGRGEDRMKGADRLRGAIRQLPDLKWVAAPGSGFEDIDTVVKTGRLSSAQIRELMKLSSGLILPSRYEGHSLVVLEALSQGIPVVATRVGGVPVLPEGLEGLVLADSGDPRALADAIRFAQKLPSDLASVEARAAKNRSILPTWSQVLETAMQAVREADAKRMSGSRHV